jgi:UDP-N-acetylmuramate: L-alanyl-gamma-D-glutamyl-meso-diaminopimelate ligase
MRIHFIAIGGAVMHNLAIALHKKGYEVSGSDDEIFEPSKSRLKAYGLLPENEGWDARKITGDIDTIILGMHARADNPELLRAREKGLNIKSFPEFIFEQTKDKRRIVVAGSHGKTTTTAMIMHVLSHAEVKFDYMVGSSVDGYETMVHLSDDSELAVLEGDEYLTSALDPRPKFHLYMPDIAVINGIAWDHMNVFPAFENYVEQFRIFITKITPGGCLIYFREDQEVDKIARETDSSTRKIPYTVHGHFRNKTGFYAATHNRVVPLKIFGEHNMQNLSAAREACMAAGITEDQFYDAIQTFAGTSRRLQKTGENEKTTVYWDFAHSPSKVKATIKAVASMHPGKILIACLELHTYSSLSAGFLPLYRGTMNKASVPVVYFNPHETAVKRLSPLTPEIITEAFGEPELKVFDNSRALFTFIREQRIKDVVYLFMSSGDFDGCDMNKLTEELLK